MFTIRAFKYDRIPVPLEKIESSKVQEDIPRLGKYKYEMQKVFACINDCTHIEIVGKYYDRQTSVYYDHSFIFSLNEHPELREWIYSVISLGAPQSIYEEDLIRMNRDTLPLIIKRIAKGCALADSRVIHNPLLKFHPDYLHILQFVKWGESLDVEPLIAEI